MKSHIQQWLPALCLSALILIFGSAHAAKTATTEQTGTGGSTADEAQDSQQTAPSQPEAREDSYILICGSGSSRVSYEVKTSLPGGYCEPVKDDKGKTTGAICSNAKDLAVSWASCKKGCEGAIRDAGSCLDSSGRTTR
jgi:hypothetical protein